MSIPGVYQNQAKAIYIKSVDAYGKEYENKIWGAFNSTSSLVTYQSVDTATRALNGLSKNTYNDTILEANINLQTVEPKTDTIGDITNLTISNYGSSEEVYKIDNFKIWGKLNSAVTYSTLIKALQNDDGTITEDNLYYLIIKNSISPRNTRLLSLISINEKLAE